MVHSEGPLRRIFFSVITILGIFMISALAAGRSKANAAMDAPRLFRGADLVLLNGKIWTGDPASKAGSRKSFGPLIEAVAISNGRFLAGGTNEEIKNYIGKETQVIDLDGRLAIPGFIDDHVHFMQGGFQLLTVDLKDAH